MYNISVNCLWVTILSKYKLVYNFLSRESQNRRSFFSSKHTQEDEVWSLEHGHLDSRVGCTFEVSSSSQSEIWLIVHLNIIRQKEEYYEDTVTTYVSCVNHLWGS